MKVGFFAALAITLLCAGLARADARIALVIGNADYGAEMGKLDNPTNDAELVADSLRGVGFDVMVVENADQKEMKRAISEFGKRLVSAGPSATALFYYAGHGIQVDGTNYLIPIHANIASEGDVDLESVTADTVLKQMEFAGTQLNIMVLDACRNNPLARSARSGTRGLARMDAPTGSFIAYSTAPGSVALDGSDRNSPFATAFAQQMQEPGAEIAETFRKVRTSVMASTGNEQVPWDSSSVTAPFYFVPAREVANAAPAPEPASEPAQAPGSASPTEIAFWESVKDSPRASDYELYLDQYPNGVFVKLAHSRLAALGVGSDASRGASAPPAAQPTPQPPVQQTASLEPAIADLDMLMFVAKLGNLRQQPSTSAPVMKQLALGDEVQVTGKVEGKDWYRVSFGGGKIGYVHASVVSSDKPAPQQQAALTPAPAPAPQAQPQPEAPAQTPAPIVVTDLNQVMYIAKKAKVRAEPNTSAKVVQQLSSGKEVQVTGQVAGGEWYRIALSSTQSAYVHRSTLTSKKPEPKTPPADTANLIAPEDQAAWDAVKTSTAKADFQAYLAKFPAGAFVAQANAQIAALDAAAAAVAAQAPQSPLPDGTIVLSPETSKKVQDYLNDNRVRSGRKRAYFFVSLDGKSAGSFFCPDKCADHIGGGYVADIASMTYDEIRNRAQKACKASAQTECVLLLINGDEKRAYQFAGQ